MQESPARNMQDLSFDLWAFDLQTYGLHVVRCRHRLNMSRASLARAAGVSEDKLLRLERCDPSISLRDAARVQRVLHNLVEDADS
jgi:DNA-binding XRE family transcriptional regulator